MNYVQRNHATENARFDTRFRETCKQFIEEIIQGDESHAYNFALDEYTGDEHAKVVFETLFI